MTERITREQFDRLSPDEKIEYCAHWLNRIEQASIALAKAQTHWAKAQQANKRFVVSLCVFCFAIGVLAGQMVERFL